MKPERVFHYFREISDIPRGSGNEKAVSDYMKKTAENLGLEVVQDELLNIYIKKPASEGCENAPGIILQGHMDMVCEKATSSKHDFEKDKIEWVIKDDLMFANDTTLGADNGIAIAMAFAVLEDDSIRHPQIEVLITTSEETEMDGALGLSDKLLEGKYLLNIDSEEEGILTLGSACGVLFRGSLEPEYENSDSELVKLHFDGFLGGHSGSEIDKNRKNMIKVFVDFIKDSNLGVASIDCGNKDNAIPRFGDITVENRDDLDEIIENFKSKHSEGEILTVDKEEKTSGKLFTADFQKKLFNFLEELPTGVDTADETGVLSSSNLAIVNKKDGVYTVHVSIRSATNKVRDELKDRCRKIAEKYGADIKYSGAYPGWEKKENSKLEKIANEVYFEETGKHFENIVIHAGLECGAIYEKYPELEIISFGPDIRDAHTPKENLSISSTERVYAYTEKLIERLADEK